MLRLMSVCMILLCASLAQAQQLVPTFASQLGDVKVGPVVKSDSTQVGFLTWGGDLGSFVANNGLLTTPDSVYGRMGVKFRFVNGDNFKQQVKDYLSGKSPYLRGTFSQIAEASEVLNADPATKPVMLYQLTWSLGDHMVGRENVKTLNDLKGKTICLQRGGPHLKLVGDALAAAALKWTDVKIKWAENLTGKDSPADMMRNDPSIDVACVISPDMIGLCGGLEDVGSGAEGSIKGSHVVVSTASMSRSIADVVVARSDYFKTAAGRTECEKLVAGYFKGCEMLLAAKKVYNDGKGKSDTYMAYLKMAQNIFTPEVLPTLEVDAHGLVSDANFVQLPGNISFFTDAGNLSNFEAQQKTTLDLVTMLGHAQKRMGFDVANWDYKHLATLAGVEYVAGVAATGRINAEAVEIRPESDLDDRTILTFNIQFKPNQETFSVDTYGSDFQRVVQNASTFGNAVIAIRGHSDPTKCLQAFVVAGLKSKALTRTGDAASGYKYFLRGQPFDVTKMPQVIDEIRQGSFQDADENPAEIMQAGTNLSQVRAENVKKAILEYAKANNLNLDPSQIQPSGVGIREPIIPKPKNMAEAERNMRVEFRLIRVKAEALKASDFDF